MNKILNATCLQDCQGSISELGDRIDLMCPQTLRVFCIDRVDGSEVLLKLIFGLKNHPYNSSMYLIHIPCACIYTNLSALQLRTYEHCSVCGCNVATVYKGRVGQLRTSNR